MGTEQVKVKAVEILECFRHTKIDLNEGSKNLAPVCKTVSRLRYRLLFLISRTGYEEAVSLNEKCANVSGFWAAVVEDLKIHLSRFEDCCESFGR